ncbi:UDP-N-acetylmuramoyl-L-alanyl-D-glutamate--2,6-diaminopimelate ligase [Orbaceae bacterium ESL0721]|nr:UDP-N-acetylmuramoyl-L-alanyl-D-glutamate--2,6-diaminopimelate ligase [Orbaceae bacterium ESL0721]
MTISTFNKLLNILGGRSAEKDFALKHLRIDSREVQKGDLFIAIKGREQDGQTFIPKALASGAAAILIETDNESDDLKIDYLESVNETANDDKKSIPLIHVFNLSKRLSSIANKYYGSPSKKLSVVGVTGTNGKTTVTQLIAQLGQLLNQKSAVLGTIGNGIYDQLKPSINTTSSAVDIQDMLADFVDKSVKIAALEISSHGLVMNRVADLSCSVTVFTNLSRDHLDFHKTMSNYAKAKWSLFSPDIKERLVANSGISILNYDDNYGKRWQQKLTQAVVVSSQPNKLAKLKTLGVRYIGVVMINYHSKGAEIHIESSWGSGTIFSHLLGEFNVSNLLLAIATMLVMDFPFFAVINMAAYLKPICGRMELIHAQNRPIVIVDYAHTPDALQKALQASRMHCKGDLWVIFGCGGDRDSGKRALMGQVAERYADKVILTNDNPRTENEMAILDDIKKGLSDNSDNLQKVQVIPDRAKAIEAALKQAREDDLILIAGKGHEDYQIIGKTKYHYSDQETVKKLLEEETKS